VPVADHEVEVASLELCDRVLDGANGDHLVDAVKLAE